MPDKALNTDQADFLELSQELLDRGRYPNQRRVVRYIDRLGWLCGGRRVK